MDKLITASDVAGRLGVSLSKAYALKEAIGYIDLGGNVRFELEAVQAYIDRCKRGPIDGEKDKWASQSVIEPRATGGSSQRRMDVSVIKQRLKLKERRSGTHRSAEPR